MLPFQILQLRMFPPIAIIIPLLFMCVVPRARGTRTGASIILYAAVTFPFVVWLMRSFFQEVPREIVGGGDRRRLHASGARSSRRCCRRCKGGLAATALFVFILNWSDFLIALVMTQDNVETAPVFLHGAAVGGAGQEYGKQAALGLHPDPAARRSSASRSSATSSAA